MEDETLEIKTLDLRHYKRPADAAKALYRHLCEYARYLGQTPELEVAIWSPDSEIGRERGGVWRVSWEAGPYEWGISLSGGAEGAGLAVIGGEGNEHWFTEPHFSFDVGFVPQ